MKANLKTAGALLGTAMLASGAMAGAVPAFAAADAVPATAPVNVVAAEVVAADASAKSAALANVVGEFAFSQDVTTSMEVFAKAAATLCSDLPSYALEQSCVQMAIRAGDAQALSTLSELMVDGEVQVHVMGCACATNAAGGGAIANAEVSGVSVESLAAKAASL